MNRIAKILASAIIISIVVMSTACPAVEVQSFDQYTVDAVTNAADYQEDIRATHNQRLEDLRVQITDAAADGIDAAELNQILDELADIQQDADEDLQANIAELRALIAYEQAKRDPDEVGNE